MTVDHSGNLVIADSGYSSYARAGRGSGGRRREPADRRYRQPAGHDGSRVQVVAHKTGTFYGQPMAAGYIYTIAGTGTAGFSGDGGPATQAKLHDPQDVAVDSAGNLLIADTGNQRIRVVAHKTGTLYGVSMTAGHIYTVAGTGTGGFSGDGGPATKAKLHNAAWVAADAAGNLLIADTGNNRVRVVAARTGTYYGVSMTAGDIYTVAGTGIGGSPVTAVPPPRRRSTRSGWRWTPPGTC